jgi:hypothetical protein
MLLVGTQLRSGCTQAFVPQSQAGVGPEKNFGNCPRSPLIFRNSLDTLPNPLVEQDFFDYGCRRRPQQGLAGT